VIETNVQVLLATYNGEIYLREQIESILAQTMPVNVLARDDGSRDGTVAILEEYARRYPERFTLLSAEASTGSAKGNFLRLMEAATADYVAFADQDDVWVREKIALERDAMQGLEQQYGADCPLLVFSDLTLVDEELKVLYESMWKQQGIDATNIHRFARIVAQNVATGCTELINRPLLQLAMKMPEDAFMHDWWVAMLASGFGASAVVSQPTVFYRQHSHNVLSAVLHERPSGVPKWREHGQRREQWEMSVHQAEALWRVHGGELTAKKREVLAAFLRCETHPNRVVRVFTWLAHGFFLNGGLRANLAILWYLWDMKAAKQAAAVV
jgi:glycosyltransferase involved in cell wall biosynthesis